MRIELSPMDYYFYRPQLYTIQLAFEYERKISIEKVKRGIARLLEKMPIVGARIVRISDFKLVLETGHEIPVRETEYQESLFDTIINEEGEPLIKILISHKEKGSIVGISFSHLLGDGASFFIFMKGLSEAIVSKELNIVTSIDRSKLSDHIRTSENLGLFDATGYIRPRPLNPDKSTVEYISYPKVKLESYGKAFSKNVIIMADLIKRFHQSIPLFENRLIVRCPVDYRKVMGLGENYFGNAVRDAVTVFDPEEIASMDFESIATKIKSSIEGVDLESVQDSLTALDSYRRNNGIDAFQELGCPGLLVTNLTNFPISQIDLGEGPPCGFEHASLNPRVAFVLKAHDGIVVKFKRPDSIACKKEN
jgi:hypothetical protein